MEEGEGTSPLATRLCLYSVSLCLYGECSSPSKTANHSRFPVLEPFPPRIGDAIDPSTRTPSVGNAATGQLISSAGS